MRVKKQKASELAAEALKAGKARVLPQAPAPAAPKAEAPKPEKGDEKPAK